MSLILHCGAAEVDYATLREFETPPATETHIPLPHAELVAMVRYALGYYGHVITEEHHALTTDGARYFGLLSLKSEYGDYTDTVGLRNSHDKVLPIGLSYGAKCLVCDNLSFRGDHVIRRKHTKGARRELPGLVGEMVEPLQAERQAQQLTFNRYHDTLLTDQTADHAVLNLYREGVINLQRIPDVLHQWEEPEHDWGDKTAWRLFNAATFSLTGRVAEKPDVTQRLHRVIDGVCETVH